MSTIPGFDQGKYFSLQEALENFRSATGGEAQPAVALFRGVSWSVVPVPIDVDNPDDDQLGDRVLAPVVAQFGKELNRGNGLLKEVLTV